MPESVPENPPQPRSAIAAALICVVLIAAAFAFFAALGARQAAHNLRVLGTLDPLIEALATSGRWLMRASFEHATGLVAAIAGVVTIGAVVGLIARRWRASPLLLLAASVVLAAWAQVELVREHPWPGGLLYAAALACALAFGIVCPAPALAPETPVRRFTRIDAPCMAVLSILGLLFRLYALPELPSAFNGEMIVSMLGSRTADGLRWYLPTGLLSNSTGLAHLLPQMLFYQLFGTSVYALRLAAVFYGVIAIPLCYWLGQRLSGTLAAIIATTLLISAPEQLFWSRLESTNFAPIAVLGLVTAHLGLSMVERLTFLRVAAVALCLPFGRYCYTAAAAMLFYPWLQYGHAALFVRGAWRRFWYVVPLLAAGTYLWAIAISLVLWLINGGSFVVHNPAQHGELILRGAGEYAGFSLPQLLLLQAQASWNNLVIIVQSIAYAGGLSEWYQRAIVVGGVSLMVPGVVAMIALSLAYLLAQIHRPRAFAILLWVAVGLLPAVLSMQPTDRRFLLIFPALYLAVGVSLQAFVEVSAQRGGKLAAAIVALLLASATAAVTVSCLASHFLLRIQRSGVEELIEFSKPIFAESDAILVDTDTSWALVFAFGNAERLLSAPPCYRSVRVGEWLAAALDPQCTYQEPTNTALLSAQRVDELRQSYRPQTFTFMVDMYMPSKAAVDMLRTLFPQARERRSSGNEAPEMIALTFTQADIDALRAPELHVGAAVHNADALQATLLSHANLNMVRSPKLTDDAALVRGGIYIKKPGWYGLGLAEPGCAGATLVIDQRRETAPGSAAPMLSGYHPFELRLPSLADCKPPITIEVRAAANEGDGEVSSAVLVAPWATKVLGAGAPPMLSFPGYGAAQAFGNLPGQMVIDFGIDAADELILLTQGDGKLHGYRLSEQAEVLASWDVTIPGHLPLFGISVAANGNMFLVAGQPVYIYDRNGEALEHWQTPPVYSAELAPLPDGRVLSAVPQENSVHILQPDGSVDSKWQTFEGGTGSFINPLSVATDNAGTIVVLQAENEVLLFHTPTDSFRPRFVRSFKVSYVEPPNPRRVGFDGAGRLLFSDPIAATPMVYNDDGVRLLASEPSYDLSTRGFEAPIRMRATRDHLYVLDLHRRLWKLPKLAESDDQGSSAPVVHVRDAPS